MPTTQNGSESVTFRLDPALKTELSRLARRDHKTLGALLRDMAQDRIDREKRRDFEAEARRQTLEAAAVARAPNTDEHAVMQELESDLEDFSGEWK